MPVGNRVRPGKAGSNGRRSARRQAAKPVPAKKPAKRSAKNAAGAKPPVAGPAALGMAGVDLLAAIVESTSDAIISKTLGGIVTSWNKGAEDIFGYSAKEMIGKSVSVLAAPGRVDEMPGILARVARGKRVVALETERRRKDGRVIQVSLTVSPVRDLKGKIVGASKIVRDITAAKRMQDELAEREQQFRSILETVPDAMIVIDAEGVIQSFSSAAERVFGYTAAEIRGQNVSRLMPSPYREAHDGYLDRYRRTGERRIIGIGRVVVAQRKDGTTFPMELSVGEAKPGARGLFTGFVRDLSEKQHFEMRLHELQHELQHISRVSEMGQMVSALAHEVNQPLAAATNYLQAGRRLLARSETGDVERASTALDNVAAQLDRTIEIIKRLRAFVHKGTPEWRPEDIGKVIEEASALALIGIRERGIDVFMDDHRFLPQVRIDKVQIQQVIINLMRNAIEAMEHSERRELRTSLAVVDGKFIAVSVIDTGPGLAPEVAQRLFMPFVSTKPQGMGIGLSICRSIVEAHGGTMSGASNPGGGTIFRFTVPIATDEAGAATGAA